MSMRQLVPTSCRKSSDECSRSHSCWGGWGGVKGTEWVSSITSSHLQFELERTGVPFACCVTVGHGALCEGHIAFCVDQDNCVGPCAIMRGANTHRWQSLDHVLAVAIPLALLSWIRCVQLLIIEDVEQLLHQSIAGQGLVADNAGEVTLAL